MDFIKNYLQVSQQIIQDLDQQKILAAIELLTQTKQDGGRLFILGVGGSAANASHAVNDFRKIAGMETYAPTDNIAELTARTNDNGWETVFAAWLKGSRLTSRDTVLFFSVSGGSKAKQISVNLIHALDYAKQIGAKTLGIVGTATGYVAQHATASIVIPTNDQHLITPQSEAFQALLWHLFVMHPLLRENTENM